MIDGLESSEKTLKLVVCNDCAANHHHKAVKTRGCMGKKCYDGTYMGHASEYTRMTKETYLLRTRRRLIIQTTGCRKRG